MIARPIAMRCLSDRALSDTIGPGAVVPHHVAVCPACLARRDALLRAPRLLLQCEVPTPTIGALADARAVLLDRVSRERQGAAWAPWMARAAAVVLLAGASWWLMHDREPAAYRAEVVEASEDARVEHSLVRTGDDALEDEVVRLREGRVRLRVAKLSAAQRFRVRVGDGEVEVRGTVFEVRAEDDRLVAVAVSEGVVVVRRGGEEAVWLRAGEAWERGEKVGAAEDERRGRAAAAAGDGGPAVVSATPSPSGPRVETAPALVSAPAATPSPAPVSASAATPSPAAARQTVALRRGAAGDATSRATAADPSTARGKSAPVAAPPPAGTPLPDDVRDRDAPVRDRDAPVRDRDAPAPSPARAEAAVPLPSPVLSKSTPPPQPSPVVVIDHAKAHHAFQLGWGRLQAGDGTEAARYFAYAEQLAGDDPVAVDAAYWAALTLSDLRAPEAEAALRRFLRLHPREPRAPVVQLRLADQLIATHRRREARALLQAVAAGTDRKRAAEARKLLETLPK